MGRQGIPEGRSSEGYASFLKQDKLWGGREFQRDAPAKDMLVLNKTNFGEAGSSREARHSAISSLSHQFFQLRGLTRTTAHYHTATLPATHRVWNRFLNAWMSPASKTKLTPARRVTVPFSVQFGSAVFSFFFCCLTSTETVRTVRDREPDRPPRLSLSS